MKAKNQNEACQSVGKSALSEHWRRKHRPKSALIGSLHLLLVATTTLLFPSIAGQAPSPLQSDPRPTIYSGQVSFGLLLSAHSTPGAELGISASQRTVSLLELDDDKAAASTTTTTTTSSRLVDSSSTGPPAANVSTSSPSTEVPSASETTESLLEMTSASTAKSVIQKRQLFEPRAHQRPPRTRAQSGLAALDTSDVLGPATCSQVNPQALFAGMGAIWASHQANLVGDSHLAIGAYIYDSCNDLDIGQRQSVRIISNLNAFQQTTCEAPRSSPISLTISHGHNQLRAIQLLTSFKVPVITTREHFVLDEYETLSREQRKFLFSTAHSSRHLAWGALRFARRLVNRIGASSKYPNRYDKESSKNGLIIISRNLPKRYLEHLLKTIPEMVNYEVVQSKEPIEQIKSVESLEAILMRQVESESRHVPRRMEPSSSMANDDSSSSAATESSMNDAGSAADQQPPETSDRIPSPTILMFITASEAIDLVTRLRNDLAEVSRYYTLIVSTRDDISPALDTIFRKGGSSLCSGKAFYTVSPHQDEIGEFSRYFRDTVQVEGETSDHPLICEYARHQAASRTHSELDDVSTEPVIKAVWAAASAFKLVHRRECASSLAGDSAHINSKSQSQSLEQQSQQQPSSTLNQQVGGQQSASSKSGGPTARLISGRQSAAAATAGRSAHADCMSRLSKNMSLLVQRALKKMDLHINSTGMHALDGFRIKFDDMNELASNKFSIKYVSNRCEITDIGSYTGLQKSLSINEELIKLSFDETLPYPWPIKAAPLPASSTPAPPPTQSVAAQVTRVNQKKPLLATASHPDEPTGFNAAIIEGRRPRQKQTAGREADETSSSMRHQLDDLPASYSKQVEPEEESTEQPHSTPSSSSNRPRKMHRSRPASDDARSSDYPTTGGRLKDAGLADTEPPMAASGVRPTGRRHRQQQVLDWLPMSAPTQSDSPEPDTRLSSSPATRTTFPANQTYKTVGGSKTTATTNSKGASGSTASSSDSDGEQQKTTQLPPRSTLPESDGNADLDSLLPSSRGSRGLAGRGHEGSMDTAASSITTNSQQYVTAPSFATRSSFYAPASLDGASSVDHTMTRPAFNLDTNHHHNKSVDILDTEPIALDGMYPSARARLGQEPHFEASMLADNIHVRHPHVKPSRTRWIYSSWFALSILGANICGALMTLYVLTSLLMRNCDGSLDKEHQSFRSVVLLAIIVILFGSTLFIIHPSPSLCLLRTSLHDFALVLLFGALLLHAMQTRASSSLGLGGRPNRLNQFLTLLFIIGVQLAAELQRWRYESANYPSFVNHYFEGSHIFSRLMNPLMQTGANNHFNPLNSFYDQVTPPVVQASEHYLGLVRDYCLIQRTEDLFGRQIYLCLLVVLLLFLMVSNRRQARKSGASAAASRARCQQPPAAFKQHVTIGGKLMASQHEANLISAPPTTTSTSQFVAAASSAAASSGVAAASLAHSNMFPVSLLSSLVFATSLILQVSGHEWIVANGDLVCSLTLVVIAFIALLGIFLPILLRLGRGGIHSSTSSSPSLLLSSNSPLTSSSASSGERHILTGSLSKMALRRRQKPPASSSDNNWPASSNGAFAIFPEFAPTGLRRPSSAEGNTSTSSGAGSRRLFVDTHEARRSMSAALADLGPSEDSLRSMGFYGSNPALEQLEQSTRLRARETNTKAPPDNNTTPHHHHQHHYQHQRKTTAGSKQPPPPPPPMPAAIEQQVSSSTSKQQPGRHQKRLIMLDVDPCCPRHGHVTEG